MRVDLEPAGLGRELSADPPVSSELEEQLLQAILAQTEELRAIRQALAAGGNTDATVEELPGLNHLFQTCTTGAVSEYDRIEETLAPAAIATVRDWLVKRLGGK